MKKFLIFLVLLPLIPFALLAQQGWFWQNPLPQGNDLKDVWVLNQNTIFAVGDRGTLLRSTNAGTDWEITYNLAGISEDIEDIQFLSEQKGWLLANNDWSYEYNNIHGSSKILITTDGGANWNMIAAFDSLCLNDLFFIDENIGWALGYIGRNYDTLSGVVLKTLDGGYNWDTLFVLSTTGQDLYPERIPYSSIQFIDEYMGWIAGKCYTSVYSPDGELLKTTDGGSSWNIINGSLACVKNFQFLNSTDGWLLETGSRYANGYSIDKTVDGGVTWESIFSYGILAGDLPTPSFHFINDSCGWISENGVIHKTIDGGLTWSTDSVFYCPISGSIHFRDNLNGCIIGKYGQISNTHDGGQSWINNSTLQICNNLTAVNFCNNNIGWLAGKGYYFSGEDGVFYGRIFKTIDGGSSWVEQYDNSGNRFSSLSSIQALTDQVIYAAGSALYKSTNGGDLWSRLDVIGDWGFNAMFFLDESIGFIGKGDWYDPGIIYKTTNGGNSWNNVLSSVHSIQSIFFSNSSEGWAVGWENPIYKTIDGGDTWQEIANNNLRLESIHFTDSNNGWAVGMNQVDMTGEGIIIKSSDGGHNWDIVYTSNEYSFNTVFFNDSLDGIAAGYGLGGGVILSTTDGGINWSYQLEGITKGLTDIFFINNNTGWAVGEDGIILKTTTGGVTFVEEEKNVEVPTEFLLSQNYPNPFNPTTKIKYTIAPPNLPNGEALVRLKVYDILGREVAVLVNEEQRPGYYEVEWNASGFSSGVYFYRIQVCSTNGGTGNFIVTKKLLFLK